MKNAKVLLPAGCKVNLQNAKGRTVLHEAFKGIDEILESADSKEYWVVKNLYNRFLTILLNEVFTDVFPQESDDDWYIFGSEHDQDPFLIYPS
ncbi:hypothetical protein LEP1GSC060_1369 [Leptospira weilii serovar Ranarum str. ICFT]|uniref:Uncharacterized protein n=1 Tax=Leptospira weilii serovar Ranarum str. ICFT TaxID=1218598 RepID=N1WLX0_9LEPT|nr:hypothetical protein [Leptospira weilii]EMY78237.1 hypothetical protein LEP1GSC060_1369 [Leptospira weilii serovar Ranarum str. ICFT]